MNSTNISYDIGRFTGLLFVTVFAVAVVVKLLRMGEGEGKKGGDSAVETRLAGLGLLLLGMAGMIAVEWFTRTRWESLAAAAAAGGISVSLAQWWLLRAAAAALPAVAGIGLARLAAGPAHNHFNTLATLLGLAGLAAGAMFAIGMPLEKPNFVHDKMAASLDAVTDAAGLTRHVPSRAELDAALDEVRKTAADLAQRQQTVNRADKAAVDALAKDIDAYNARQAAVKKMFDDYTAGPRATAALRAQIAGKWKEPDELLPTGATRKATAEFQKNGTVDFMLQKNFAGGPPPLPPGFASMSEEQKKNIAGSVTSVNGAVRGTWSLSGRTLSLHISAEESGQMGEPADQSLTVQSVDDKAMTLTTPNGGRVWTRE